MNCSNCGGCLKFDRGIYICESCGTQQTIFSVFKNIEVFISYIESDMHGRRTRESVIAQDIYNRLEKSKINTFFQRISVADLTGDDFNKACNEAINYAKVILIVGTSKTTFEQLLEDNVERFGEKTIVPIYSDMDAYEIPYKIADLQAVNYENISAMTALPQNILHILGRENEIDIVKSYDERTRKKRKKVLLLALTAAIITVACSIYIVFCTPYVLKSKKYSYAEQLTEDKRYIEAIDVYSKLGDYKNASNNLKNIYSKYNGYYISEDEKYGIHFNIENNKNSNIEIIYYNDNKQIKLTSEATLKDNAFDYFFVDNQNNQGQCKIMLLDDGIKFTLNTEEKISELYIADCDLYLTFNEKSDAPLIKKIDRDTIISWLKNGLTKSELQQQGYEFDFKKQLGNGSAGNLCNIINTDIHIEFGEENAMSMLIPAEIIIPNMIGTNIKYINEDGILYIPYGDVGMGVRLSEDSGKTINTDTLIAVTSRVFCERMIPDKYYDWDEVLLDMVYSDVLKEDIYNRYNVSFGFFKLEAKNNNDLLMCTDLGNQGVTNVFYKVSKTTGKITFIKELPCNVGWENYPELFGEFL